MLPDKRAFWDSLTAISSDELSKPGESNPAIAKTEKEIGKLLESGEIDKVALEEEYRYLIHIYESLAYIQGLQDGVKMLHLLLSGEAVNHMQRLGGDKADSPEDVKWRK